VSALSGADTRSNAWALTSNEGVGVKAGDGCWGRRVVSWECECECKRKEGEEGESSEECEPVHVV
jgi:hypothetical protein